jgi:hypothetical protein
MDGEAFPGPDLSSERVLWLKRDRASSGRWGKTIPSLASCYRAVRTRTLRESALRPLCSVCKLRPLIGGKPTPTQGSRRFLGMAVLGKELIPIIMMRVSPNAGWPVPKALSTSLARSRQRRLV